MFMTISAVIVLAFCCVTIALPFRYPETLKRIFLRVRERLLGEAEEARFEDPLAEDRRVFFLLRAWGAGAIVVFLVLAVADDRLLRDGPAATAATAGYAFLAMGSAGLLLYAAFACRHLAPRLRSQLTLNRGGVCGVWMVDRLRHNAGLQDRLAQKAQASSRICIVDVTGYEILGRGSGSSGGLLYDVLDMARQVPAYIVLCKPDAQEVDPDCRKTSVLQNLLAEMHMSHSTYMRRLRMTTDAVEALNQNRPPEAWIQVKFYREKPTFRSIILDDSCIALPWHPREDRAKLPYLDIAKDGRGCSFYESFRRHFARLWGAPVAAAGAATRRRDMPERAVSGSFAVRPVSLNPRRRSAVAAVRPTGT